MKQEEKIKWDYRNEINKPLKSGTLLLAQPFMDDPNFIRSTCLIVNHIKEEGTFGFVLNQKTNKKLSHFIDADFNLDFDVYYGGPVGNDSLFFLHTNEHHISGAKKISNNIYWNGNFDEIMEKIEAGIITSSEILFFLGYSGWDKGQLRKEIIENSWIVQNDEHFALKNFTKNLWKNTLLKMKGIYAEFANFPINPNLN